MTLRSAILALLLCAAHAQARTLYVSLTGSHDTNAPAFSTWATAATNIQAAIDAASDGDTVRVEHGTYYPAVDNGLAIISVSNKTGLTVIGGRGTLFDADKTILDCNNSTNRAIHLNNSTNCIVAGFTATKCKDDTTVFFGGTTVGNELNSCIVRNNDMSGTMYGSGIKNYPSGRDKIINTIVVGNICATGHGGIETCSDGTDVIGCIVEANTPYQFDATSIYVANSIYGNSSAAIINRGGNITSNTTNSVCRLLGIAPAGEGVGTNLVWRGVSAYIPRLDSLARKNGVIYAGIATASDGAGGPALVTSRPFLGRDATTNLNHGAAIGGVTSSTNSPFAGERSANFTNNSSDHIFLGNGLDIRTNDITVEAWINPASTNAFMGVFGKSLSGSASGRWSLYVASIYKIRFLVQYGGTVVSLDSTSAVATGAWTHAAAVWRRGSGITMYVNGVSNSFASAADSTDLIYNYPVSIGRYDRVAPFNGCVSDCRVWNVARTPAEIQANYTNRLTGTEPGLVGYWRLDERRTISPIDTGPFNLDNPIIHPSYHEAF